MRTKVQLLVQSSELDEISVGLGSVGTKELGLDWIVSMGSKSLGHFHHDYSLVSSWRILCHRITPSIYLLHIHTAATCISSM